MTVSTPSLIIGLCLVGTAFAQPATDERVTNGGFETGNFSGWSLFGNTNDMGVASSTPQGDAASHSGSFGAYFGQLDFIGSGGIFQAISTMSGQEYTLSFWLKSGPQTGLQGAPNTFEALWNGSPVQSLINPGPFPFSQSSFVVTASSSSTDLRFRFANNADFFILDDVSVKPRSTGGPGDPTIPVPEAESIWLFGVLTLAGVGAARQRSLRIKK